MGCCPRASDEAAAHRRSDLRLMQSDVRDCRRALSKTGAYGPKNNLFVCELKIRIRQYLYRTAWCTEHRYQRPLQKRILCQISSKI